MATPTTLFDPAQYLIDAEAVEESQGDFQLDALGATTGPAWRKEWKAARLAAWVATAGF